MSTFSIDLDIDDIIYSMTRYDRKEFFEEMQQQGYISESCVITNEGEVEASAHLERNAKYSSQNEFNHALQKLFDNGWRLTSEEEEYIINISKRFP